MAGTERKVFSRDVGGGCAQKDLTACGRGRKTAHSTPSLSKHTLPFLLQHPLAWIHCIYTLLFLGHEKFTRYLLAEKRNLLIRGRCERLRGGSSSELQANHPSKLIFQLLKIWISIFLLR